MVASFAVTIIGRNITKYFASPGGAAVEIAGQFHGHKGEFTRNVDGLLNIPNCYRATNRRMKCLLFLLQFSFFPAPFFWISQFFRMETGGDSCFFFFFWYSWNYTTSGNRKLDFYWKLFQRFVSFVERKRKYRSISCVVR